MTYNLSDYNFDLPPDLIAQDLTQPADHARMMVIDQWQISHEGRFDDIINHLEEWDLIIFNNSKVVPARIALTESDTIITTKNKQINFIIWEAEIFFLRHYSNDRFEALVRRGKWFKIWSIVRIGKYKLIIGKITLAGRIITLSPADSSFIKQQDQNLVMQFLHDHGTIPLPPYIEDNENKHNDYQPIIATQEGSVAAPTAALHFTDRLLLQIDDIWVLRTEATLHIGIGTFRLIDVDDVRDHEIHREWCQINTHLFTQIAQTHCNHQKITIIGTTSTRIIESLPYVYLHLQSQIILDDHIRKYWDSLTLWLIDPWYIVDPYVMWDDIFFDTQLFMYPWFTPKIINHLVTNFHLPKSTLLLMISSLIGYDILIQAYETGIEQEYMFYSFGDAMLIKNIL